MARKFPVYSRLLNLYPVAFQKSYSRELLQTTSDMLDHAGTRPRRALVWLRIWADFPSSVLAEQMNYQGDLYMKDTPKYLKAASVISGLMLLPFVLILFANFVDRLIYHGDLNHTWLWQAPFLKFWILTLPEAALLFVLIAFVIYAAEGRGSSFFSRAVDIRRTWLVVLPGLMALGILFVIAFHDSFQCFMPGYVIGHTANVVQCAVNNQSLPIFRKFF